VPTANSELRALEHIHLGSDLTDEVVRFNADATDVLWSRP